MNLVNEICGSPYRAPWRTCESLANCLGTGDSSLIFNPRKSGLRREAIIYPFLAFGDFLEEDLPEPPLTPSLCSSLRFFQWSSHLVTLPEM